MANGKPSLESFISQPQANERPSLDSFVSQPQAGLESFVSEQTPSVLENIPATEERIAKRKSGVQELGKTISKAGGRLLDNAIENKMSIVGVSPTTFFTPEEAKDFGLATLTGFGQATESPFANIALELQTEAPTEPLVGGVVGAAARPIETVKSAVRSVEAFKEGITGERVGEFGDVYRNLGLPEPVAATLGFATAVMLDPTKVKQKLFVEPIDVSTKKVARLMRKNNQLVDAGKPKLDFTEKARRIKKAINDKHATNLQKMKLTSEAAITEIQKNTDDLIKQLDEGAGLDARKAQIALQDYSKKASKQYGDYIDSMAKNLKRKGQEIRLGEVEDMAKNILNDIQARNLPQGRGVDAVVDFAEKYSSSTKPLRRNKKIDTKQFLEDFRNVKNSIATDINTGKLTPESLAADEFRKMANNFIEGRVPGWKDLNRKYAQVVELTGKAGTIFKQGKGKFFTKQGEDFLKQYAEEAISQGDKVFVESLEKGVPGFGGTGLGDITKRVQRLQQKINQNTASIEDIKEFSKLKRVGAAKAKGEAIETISRQQFKARKLTNIKRKRFLKQVSTKVGRIAGAALIYKIIRNDLSGVRDTD